jgi:hypothetical protein
MQQSGPSIAFTTKQFLLPSQTAVDLTTPVSTEICMSEPGGNQGQLKVKLKVENKMKEKCYTECCSVGVLQLHS